jgi:RNA polymerase sigma factor (sigma-70 family)
MAKEQFELLGHDDPLGYPAPVVPVGRLDGSLVAFYASDRVTVIVLDDEGVEFIRYGEALKASLRDFDYQNERLFGFNYSRVVSYKIDEQAEYFQSLLKDIHFSLDNPFLRLSLAKATGESHLTIREIFLCSLHLARKSTHFTEAWYRTQRELLEQGSDLINTVYLPVDWWELRYFLTPDQAQLVESSVNTDYIQEPEQSVPEYRTPDHTQPFPSRSYLRGLSDADLVGYFNSTNPKSTEGAHAFEEVVSRYIPLIRQVVRRYEKVLPSWDSIDDITSRAIFTLYKNMHLLDPTKYIRGYITAIAENTARNALRKGKQEDRYFVRESDLSEDVAMDPINRSHLEPRVEGDFKTTEQSILLNQLLTEISRDHLDVIIFRHYFIRGLKGRELFLSVRKDSGRDAPSTSTIYRRIDSLRTRMLSWFEKRGITSLNDLL